MSLSVVLADAGDVPELYANVEVVVVRNTAETPKPIV
jgi:hypothetical protein